VLNSIGCIEQHYIVAAVSIKAVFGELHLVFLVRYQCYRQILIMFIDCNDYWMLLNLLTLQSQHS